MTGQNGTFTELVSDIELAYRELGHTLGWRFLYTPARTMSPETGIALVPLNPGGGAYEPPVASVEIGNAYRVEHWRNGGHNPLQTQIMRLYKGLAQRLGDPDWKRLMDDTFAANFCPFRSQAWPPPNRGESVEFSKALWAKVLTVVAPRVVVCLGAESRRYVPETLIRLGAEPVGEPVTETVHWEPQTYTIADYRSARGETRVVGLPHLSRFAIFGRTASRPATTAIVNAIADAVENGSDPGQGRQRSRSSSLSSAMRR